MFAPVARHQIENIWRTRHAPSTTIAQQTRRMHANSASRQTNLCPKSSRHPDPPIGAHCAALLFVGLAGHREGRWRFRRRSSLVRGPPPPKATVKHRLGPRSKANPPFPGNSFTRATKSTKFLYVCFKNQEIPLRLKILYGWKNQEIRLRTLEKPTNSFT